MGPVRSGLVFGVVAAIVALLAELYFLFIDPAHAAAWILAVIGTYRTRLALAVFLFLAILAATRTQPKRLDPGVPRRSLLLRDCALAATVVAVVVGSTLFVLTALKATVFADDMRAFSHEAAPRVVSSVNGMREAIRTHRKAQGASKQKVNDLPPPAKVSSVAKAFRPPALGDLGQSLANFVLRALLLGTAGAVVGLLRGRSSRNAGEATSEAPSETRA